VDYKNSTVKFVYDLGGDKKDKDCVIANIKFPEVYAHLLKDGTFVSGLEAMLLHLTSTLFLEDDVENNGEALLEIHELRQKLYDRTLEIVEEAARKALDRHYMTGEELEKILNKKKNRFNSFTAEILCNNS
jgi:hypothetical protein